MTKLTIFSEPYVAAGNIGENLRNLLGAPTINRLHALIRESIQNISDAAKHNEGPGIKLSYRKPTKEQKELLSSSVFLSLPPKSAGNSRESINRFLRDPDARVLEICDFKTTGLGGPTRADRIPEGEGDTDFIDFLRNIGTPRDTPQGGGTYGFGKVSLYQMSRCATIIVDTQVKGAGEEGRRLIACHVGASFKTKEDGSGMLINHTGRHWWGITQPDDPFADPLVGPKAAELAHRLGFPERGIEDSGTSIMILDIDAAEVGDNPGQVIEEAVLWNFWPRLTEDADPKRKFELIIEVDGKKHSCRSPEEIAPFHLFAKAMKSARKKRAVDASVTREEVKSVARYNEKVLGQLTTVTDYVGSQRFVSSVNEDNERLVPARLSHIALMRPAELVVKYVVGDPLADDAKEWCGVFLVDEDDAVERAFAAAEPPAHDDWIAANLPNGTEKKSFVATAMRRIKQVAGKHSKAFVYAPGSEVEDPRLRKVAKKMGRFLASAQSTPIGPTRPKKRKPHQQRRRGGLEVQVFLTGLKMLDKQRIASFEVKVARASDESANRKLRLTPIVVKDDGSALKADDDFKTEIINLEINDLPADLNGAVPINVEGAYLKCDVVIPGLSAVTVKAEMEYCGND